MVNVSWNDAVAFCEWLSNKEGVTYRLPTEAQWEYSCRVGSLARFSFGDDERLLEKHAWYGGRGGKHTNPVGQKQPNAWGLFDMHGNVGEWCHDWFGPYVAAPAVDPLGSNGSDNRLLRGGSFVNFSSHVRSATRNFNRPTLRYGNYGFRIIRAFEEPKTATPYAHDRAVAEWVLSNGSHCGVEIKTADGKNQSIAATGRLPQAPFQLVGIVLLKPEETPLAATHLAMIAKLKNLKRLDLYRRTVERSAIEHIEQMTSLEYLAVNRIPLTDADMPRLAKLVNLSTLGIGGQISDAGLAHLSKLTKLEHFSIEDAHCTARGLMFLKNRRLKMLKLINLPMGDEVLPLIEENLELEILFLQSMPITDAGFANVLPKLTKLHTLYLGHTGIGDKTMQVLSQRKSYPRLDIESTNVTDAGLKSLIKPPGETGYFAHYRLRGTKITDLGISYIMPSTAQSVDVRDTALTDKAIPALSKLTTATMIDLHGTRLTAAGVAQLKKALPKCSIRWEQPPRDREVAEWFLENGQTIKIHVDGQPDGTYVKKGDPLLKEPFKVIALPVGTAHAKFTAEQMKLLKELTAIEVLDLSFVRVQDADFVHLAGLTSLIELNLQNTQIGDEGVKHFARLVNLRKLNLDNCRVTAKSFTVLKRLKNLQSIRLQNVTATAAERLQLEASLPKCKIHLAF